METNKLNIGIDGEVIVTHNGTQYSEKLLGTAIAKSPTAKLDEKIPFHESEFDQAQFSDEWRQNYKKLAVIMFEGKYLIIARPLDLNVKTSPVKTAVLVSKFTLKKAEYQSQQEAKRILAENENQEAQYRASNPTQFQRRPYPERFDNRPRFSQRSK